MRRHLLIAHGAGRGVDDCFAQDRYRVLHLRVGDDQRRVTSSTLPLT